MLWVGSAGFSSVALPQTEGQGFQQNERVESQKTSSRPQSRATRTQGKQGTDRETRQGNKGQPTNTQNKGGQSCSSR